MWHDMRALYVHKLHDKAKRKPNRKYFSSQPQSDESIDRLVLQTMLSVFVVAVGLGVLLLIAV